MVKRRNQCRGPVRPKNVPEKEKKRCASSAWAAGVLPGFGIAFDAGWGTWERLPCAHFAYTPKWLKKQGGTPPFDHFPFKNYAEILEFFLEAYLGWEKQGACEI